MKNSNDIIGDRTRDLPVCSAVPQPTAPPRKYKVDQIKKNNYAKHVARKNMVEKFIKYFTGKTWCEETTAQKA